MSQPKKVFGLLQPISRCLSAVIQLLCQRHFFRQQLIFLFGVVVLINQPGNKHLQQSVGALIDIIQIALPLLADDNLIIHLLGIVKAQELFTELPDPLIDLNSLKALFDLYVDFTRFDWFLCTLTLPLATGVILVFFAGRFDFVNSHHGTPAFTTPNESTIGKIVADHLWMRMSVEALRDQFKLLHADDGIVYASEKLPLITKPSRVKGIFENPLNHADRKTTLTPDAFDAQRVYKSSGLLEGSVLCKIVIKKLSNEWRKHGILFDAAQWPIQLRKPHLLFKIVKITRDSPLCIDVQVADRSHARPFTLEEFRLSITLHVIRRVVGRLLRHAKLDLQEELVVAGSGKKLRHGADLFQRPLIHHVNQTASIQRIACETIRLPHNNPISLPELDSLKHFIEKWPPCFIGGLGFDDGINDL